MQLGRRIATAGVSLLLAVATMSNLLGCGAGGPKTYPVRGTVQIEGGDIRQLAESTVEAALESDDTVRASGSIQADGAFTLETLHAGNRLNGAQAGNYRARIILSEDGDKEARRKLQSTVHARFLQFETSGLSFQVPTTGSVVLKITAR